MAAEAVLSAALSVLLNRIVPTHLGIFIRGRDVEKDLNKLKKTVRKIDQVMNDAEDKQFKNPSVKIWLDELRDAAYDAEDVIEEFAMKDLRRMKLKLEADQSQTIISPQPSTTSFFASMRHFSSKIESKIMTCVSSTSSSKLESKIKEITERFNDLAQERFELGLEEIKAVASWSSSSSHAAFRETSSLPGNYPVLGREVDKAKIINLLTSPSSRGNELIVIPIVGMGGVGKTTLAQLVYNDNSSLKDHHFNFKAWVCVSSVEFDVKIITKTILDQSDTYQTFHSSDLNQLQVGLQKALAGKKFLIVLDDVWNKDYSLWDDLRKPFGVGAPGSGIIITTRDIEIGSNMGTVGNHSLNKLSEDDCWSVFVQHAFWRRNVDAYPDPDLVVIGKEIAGKCDGLPLAAKSLGGLLRAKEKSEWENVLNSKIWDLEEDGINILPVLKLSYHYLPSYLKRCFAYCSIFPKDYEFEEEKLVWLWMAEGFLEQPNGKMELEDFGHKCFRVLLSRSFFQPSSSSESMYVMHHLMSDLAQWAAGQTCLRLEDSWDRRRQCIKARHLSYICGQYCEVQKFENLYGVEFLRTFLQHIWCRIESLTFDLLLKMKFLRVLSLPGHDITELPSSIGDLKHLRYIDISYSEIRSIPESVCTLYNLQTLLLKSCSKLTKLPEELQKLINLRHFDISETSTQSIPESVCTLYNLQTLLLNSCSNLTKLPEELRSLINLRHLDISNASLDWMEAMPPHIGQLTSLRKLSNFVVCKDSGCGIEELANLKHLEGTLRISKLENVIDAEQAKAANLSDKKGLDVLEMEWCSQFDNPQNERVENDVLDKLRPHEKLKELRIICYGGVSFPTWVGEATFSSMVLLKLEGCEKCTHLPPLGQLPLLKNLSIRRMNGVITVGPEFYGKGCSNPFPSLETLSIVDMKEWRDWPPCAVEMRKNLFPLLRKLSLKECPNLLGSLPDHLPSLEKLDVHKCERLTVSISSHPKLEKLEFYGCQEVVQGTNVNLISLKFLRFEYISRATFLTEGWEDVSCDELVIQSCENVENLKGLHNWTSLRVLKIEECLKLVSFPKKGLPATLRHLQIKDCEALQSVSEAILGHNSSLELLDIESCDSLTSIARASLLFSRVKKLKINSCHSLQSLMEEDVEGSSLMEEDVDGSSSSSSSLCSEMMMMPDSSNSRASILEVLYIWECPSLTSLFSSSSSSRGELPATLKTLEINYCPKLESLGERFHSNPSLHKIDISSCESFKYLPENLHSLTSLYAFTIFNCPSLVRFPDGGLPAANLRNLYIDQCDKLEALPNRMHHLTSLQKLSIRNCPGIVSLSFPQEEEEDGFPTSITELQIEGPNKCKALFQWGLHRLSSLTKLVVRDGCPLDQVSFPAVAEGEIIMVLPSSLINLIIYDFPNLESLSSKWFQNLTSLKELRIRNCPKLQYFPENGLPPSLLKLYINNCTLLKQGEWSKISHVPYIEIDFRTIQGGHQGPNPPAV